MDSPDQPKLTDGVILLRPLGPEDAADHLTGEDEEMAKWLSGGHSTIQTVQAFIARSQESWRTGGPRRPFGIFDCKSRELIGAIEFNLLDPALEPGQANISYGVFRQWRGRRLASRAIELVAEYLRARTDARQMVLRIAPANAASLKIPGRAGFAFCGVFDEPQGRMARYVRDLKPE